MKNIIIIALITLFTAVTVNAQSYKVIVNTDNTTTSISKSDLSDIFLKKDKKWANGDKATPVDQVVKSDVRASFSSDVHGKSVSSIKSYWQQYVFAGKGAPPVEKKSDAEIVNFVSSNRGAVGYVLSDVNTTGVKVIEVN